MTSLQKMLGIPLFLFLFFIPLTSAKEIDFYSVGSKISLQEIVGKEEEYFESYSILENSEVYSRIYGKSFPIDGSLSLSQLRYLKMVYYNYSHEIMVGEMIVHTNLAQDVLNLFQEIFKQEIEIYSMRLIDDFWPVDKTAEDADLFSMQANNTSCFNYRVITNGQTLSYHAKGMAIDKI